MDDLSIWSANWSAKTLATDPLLGEESMQNQYVSRSGEIALRLRMVDQITNTSKDLGPSYKSMGQTELDKTVVDKIADPLTHLVCKRAGSWYRNRKKNGWNLYPPKSAWPKNIRQKRSKRGC